MPAYVLKLEPKAQDVKAQDAKQEQDEEPEQEEEKEQDEEQHAEMTEYERKRRENIQRNLAFMQQMGVSTAKIEARTAVGDDPATRARKEQQALKRALQAARRAERLAQPVRKSRRLEGKKVEVEPIESIDQFEMDQMRGPRPPRGSNLHVMDAVDGESKAFLGGITADLEEEEELEEDTILDDDDGIEYTLADEDITKAVQERIYSVAFLPRADRVVVACGDKMGHVALWTPPSESSVKHENSALPLAVYRPHYTPVSQLIFADSSKLVSSSFDGTVREFDLRAAESSVVYDTSDDAGISSLVAASTAQCYYASCDDGTRKASDKSAVTLPKSIRVRHNNVTGRWLTKLHAAWDPKRPNQFVIGCMEQPRRIQIFRAGRRRPVRELKSDNFASVHSINAFHPHLELIAGGNSSGRLALWRGKKTDKDDNVMTESKDTVRVKDE
ncbi:unnamed protein product [Phytophthora lilii]|uniref:Unnamed protein product n=1 Tax=Phytophthora lilii TaxID=2077276 RepID=A0A9W6WZT7_9STRA|nr:unnamed protein product [Phytophthora lilii]